MYSPLRDKAAGIYWKGEGRDKGEIREG